MKAQLQRITAQAGRHRWLLFVHQLPASPSNLRVRAWRRLQQIGAIAVKQGVYALPDSPSAREDFEWLEAEVRGRGGDASVFAAETLDSWSDDALVEEFKRTRQEAYRRLAEEIEGVTSRLAARPRRGRRTPDPGRLIAGFRQRLTALEQIDFFGSAGRDNVVWLLTALEEQVSGARPGPAEPKPGTRDRKAYSQRLWVTRPRPGVDRMSSAWLIRRFIDPAARFAFAPDHESLPEAGTVPFDMFGVEFSHRGNACTFETLCTEFRIEDAAVNRIATIVHDLDLKDSRFGAPEAGTVAALIDGLQMATTDDETLLERGMLLFESLYMAFARSARLVGPRRVAKPRQGRTARAPASAGRRRR